MLVLLIESQPHMLELLRSKFEVEGFSVVTAKGGEGALALARERSPSLIVLDGRVTAGDGRPLSQKFGEDPDLARIPIILMTQRATGQSEEDSRPGAVPTIQFPFRPRQLLALARQSV